MRPKTERGRAMLAGLVLVALGLTIGLPPVALWGPGAGLTVPGLIVFALAIRTPPEAVP